ncbi:MAG: alpha-1,4-glucan--maltose-1-phosphate maltosyltransferase [Chloroflexi bacterium]|nr:alpha-1,4-glucan--maltose-1-phosphate maltosyltransferase [Chloroflexota bacterium]
MPPRKKPGLGKEGEGRIRAAIEGVTPQIDGGRFPIKRVVGETVVVEADIFTDGQDAISAALLYCKEDDPPSLAEAPLEHLGQDRWRGAFTVTQVGRYRYTLMAWVDPFQSWCQSLVKKVEAAQDVSMELQEGARLLREASERAPQPLAGTLKGWGDALVLAEVPYSDRIQLALSPEVASVMDRYPQRLFAYTYPQELLVVVDRERARFSAWYEMFPRSCAPEPGRQGTFADCEARLPYIAAMGFDVLYLPPIHPIGHTHRKGRNNAPQAGDGEPGSPWAIGSEEGGYQSIHPQLGTLEDFRRLLAKAQEWSIEVALDLAFHCSPDHPYVREHPEWFRRRRDGSVQYAENPPKKYEDIYPLDFETPGWRELWEELKRVVLFWIEQGIRIFRVDNPHTKPFRFWEWLIAQIKEAYPDVIFLSEAFTRPKVMYRLAKLGFTQSYTYFAWRNNKGELTQYFTELTHTERREYFRGNLWPNTPDILTEYLHSGGRPAYMARLILAATLGASYGIYGPAFELCQEQPKEPGSEEYLDSEKYEIKHWDIGRPDSLAGLIARVNQIRRENPALQRDWGLRFHPVDNNQLFCYTKSTPDNVILVVVNLDSRYTQSGWVDLEALGLDPHQPYQVHDLINDARYLWHGPRNYVELNPQGVPAHIFRLPTGG